MASNVMVNNAIIYREIISRLENTYCRSIGVEFMHLFDIDGIQFIRERMETPGIMEKTVDEKRLIMRRLTKAVLLVVAFRFSFPTFLSSYYSLSRLLCRRPSS